MHPVILLGWSQYRYCPEHYLKESGKLYVGDLGPEYECQKFEHLFRLLSEGRCLLIAQFSILRADYSAEGTKLVDV